MHPSMTWNMKLTDAVASKGGTLLFVPEKTKQKARLRCAKGHEFEVRVDAVFRGSWCKVCFVDARRMPAEVAVVCLKEKRAAKEPRPVSLAVAEAACERAGVELVRCVDAQRAEVKCACGRQWVAWVSNLRGGHGCKVCSSKRGALGRVAAIDEKVLIVVAEKGGEVVSKGPEWTFRCGCGWEWQTSKHVVLHGHWCSKCRDASASVREKAKREVPTEEKVRELVASKGGTVLSIEDKSTGDVSVRCAEGHEWQTKNGTLLYLRAWCRVCALAGQSAPQQELYAFVKGLREDAVPNATGVLPGRAELDVWVPSLGVGVEFDGLYWHSSEKANVSAGHKYREMRRLGFRLITVFEDEWATKRGLVERILRAKLGVPMPAVGARECAVVEVDGATCDAFLEENHIQGAVPASKRLGLEHGGRLVAVACFSVDKQYTTGVGLTRFCTVGDTRVVGALPKLMAACPYPSVTTMADFRWSDGGLYEKTGWVKHHERAPTFEYVRGGRRYSRKNLQVWRMKRDGKVAADFEGTEEEAAAALGYRRLYGCGSATYTWSRK